MKKEDIKIGDKFYQPDRKVDVYEVFGIKTDCEGNKLAKLKCIEANTSYVELGEVKYWQEGCNFFTTRNEAQECLLKFITEQYEIKQKEANNLRRDMEELKNELNPPSTTQRVCNVCDKPQFHCRSGWVCENGHGGADYHLEEVLDYEKQYKAWSGKLHKEMKDSHAAQLKAFETIKDVFVFDFFNEDTDVSTILRFKIENIEHDFARLLDEDSEDAIGDFTSEMEGYGVHDWSSGSHDIVGFTSYEIDKDKYMEVMNKWRDFLIEKGLQCSPITKEVVDNEE